MPDSLPNVHFTMSLDDLYALYCASVAESTGRDTIDLAPPLHALLTTLRGRWLDAHIEERLAELPDGLDWLAAQQTLKERTIGS